MGVFCTQYTVKSFYVSVKLKLRHQDKWEQWKQRRIFILNVNVPVLLTPGTTSKTAMEIKNADCKLS